MTAAGTFIPKIFEEHLETAGLLWASRRMAIKSREYMAADILDLEEVIEAHVEGLIAAGDDSLPLLEAELSGADPLRAFAAAFALLRVGTPEATRLVLEAFAEAKEAKLDGLRDALAHGPAASLAPQLTSLFLVAPAPTATAAGEVLAFHGMLKPSVEQLERLARADESVARTGAWRLAAYCGVALPAEWYAAGLRDDIGVKRAVLETAAWSGSPGFYPYARSLAATPAPETLDAIALFAAIATPEEYQLIGAVAATPAAGPDRFRVIGSFGHPYFVPFLIDAMAKNDPSAASAAAAFEKMTGHSVASKLVKQDAADGEVPEAEFVPDPESARIAWQEFAPRLAHVPRIARGMDVSQPLSREQFAALDMESRYEHCLRARLFSGWQGTPLVLERYPQRF
jgi:uncharacterized protein (TIGR02270 family)